MYVQVVPACPIETANYLHPRFYTPVARDLLPKISGVRIVVETNAERNMASELTPDQAEQLSRIGAAAASSAIAKGLDEDKKPDMKKINDLATLAASAAIQKHLGEETEGNKEKAADIARAVASSAISRGFAPESKDPRAFERVESIAKEAAVAAMNMGVGKT